MKAMRLSNELIEIDSTFKFFREQKIPFLLWQNRGVERNRFRAEIIFMDSKSKEMHFRIEALDGVSLLEKNEELYFFGEHKSTVFKSTLLSQAASTVVITYPTTMRVQEYRTAKRHTVIKIPNCTVTLAKNSGEATPFTFRLNDISGSGFSFIINHSSKDQFAKGEKIVLNQIMSDELKPITALVKHVSLYVTAEKTVDVKLYKIGLEFDDSLDLEPLYIHRKFLAFN